MEIITTKKNDNEIIENIISSLEEVNKIYFENYTTKYIIHSLTKISAEETEANKRPISDKQKDLIISKINNKVQDKYIDLKKELIDNVKYTYQADKVIKLLDKFSTISQREIVSDRIKNLVNSNVYFNKEALKNMLKSNMYNFTYCSNIIVNGFGVEGCTEEQAKQIIKMLKSLEVQQDIKSRGIDVDKYVYLENNNWKIQNKQLLNDIMYKIGKLEASHIIQRFNYIHSFEYVNNDQVKELNRLYQKLNMIEQSNPFMVKSILKKDFTKLYNSLYGQWEQLKLCEAKSMNLQIFATTGQKHSVQESKLNNQYNEEVRMTKELLDLARKVFNLGGQKIPSEIQELLYYNNGYSGIRVSPLTENEQSKYRQIILEQIKILNKIDNRYTLKYFYFELSTDIQEILLPGLW